ncbi:hypothetical protein [Actinokineospora enzanensis]|uniref:restriction endonuclease-related protein n=1 Tax=Actinokineospora enzanensis TaxID=155975 RepID=UPI00039AE485|nr:hypothetical protein [Actinokineospora enzanensis]
MDESVLPTRAAAETRRRDQAVTACCLAAAVAGAPDLAEDKRADALMSCLGVLTAAHRIDTAPTMSRFRAGLRGPLRDLLPRDIDITGIGDLVLLDDRGRFTDEAEDLCAEFLVPSAALEEHWPWHQVAAEQEERRVYEVLRRLPEAEYARLRAHLVDEPVGDLRSLRRVCDGSLSQFYEPIAQWPWRQVRGWYFPCPDCRWPMRVVDGDTIVEVRCEAHARHGITYTCRTDGPAGVAPELRPVGRRAPEVAGQPATRESLAVRRVVWRYVTLPGLLECRVRDHALRLGAEVVMWPHRDRYDLAVTLGEQVWRVDAKAWASPVALGEALRGTRPAAPGLLIVVPDHQRPSLELLRHLVGGSGYRVLTAKDLKTELTRAAAVAA